MVKAPGCGPGKRVQVPPSPQKRIKMTNKKRATGHKYDKDKNRYDLMPPRALDSVVEILTYGAAKYADRDWEKGIEWGRLFGAAQRHLWSFWRGEDIDPESGLPHLSHAACNILMLIEYYFLHNGTDDRAKEK